MNVVERTAYWIEDELGREIAGPFTTNAQAWSWVDQNTQQGWDDAAAYQRISNILNRFKREKVT